jgi:hypothetical protein
MPQGGQNVAWENPTSTLRSGQWLGAVTLAPV